MEQHLFAKSYEESVRRAMVQEVERRNAARGINSTGGAERVASTGIPLGSHKVVKSEPELSPPATQEALGSEDEGGSSSSDEENENEDGEEVSGEGDEVKQQDEDGEESSDSDDDDDDERDRKRATHKSSEQSHKKSRMDPAHFASMLLTPEEEAQLAKLLRRNKNCGFETGLKELQEYVVGTVLKSRGPGVRWSSSSLLALKNGRITQSWLSAFRARHPRSFGKRLTMMGSLTRELDAALVHKHQKWHPC